MCLWYGVYNIRQLKNDSLGMILFKYSIEITCFLILYIFAELQSLLQQIVQKLILLIKGIFKLLHDILMLLQILKTLQVSILFLLINFQLRLDFIFLFIEFSIDFFIIASISGLWYLQGVLQLFIGLFKLEIVSLKLLNRLF